MGIEQYQQTVRALSDRIVEAQRPIRILDAIKWETQIQQEFFAQDCRELPKVDADYYQKFPLPFDPLQKHQELQELELDIYRKLGDFNPIGGMMRRMVKEYQLVVDMLQVRGKPEFSQKSRHLYGSAYDAFSAGQPSLTDLGVMMSSALDHLEKNLLIPNEEKNIPADQAVQILQERLSKVFPIFDKPIEVKLSDGIISDASAGSDYIKIRRDAVFSDRDLRLLEVHEGWVHLGTTFNGMAQPVCTFLSKGPPSSTVTQEGLAILMEVLAFVSFPERLRRLTNRIRAVGLAEQGADFLEVFRFFRDQGYQDEECWQNTVRVFRGSTPTCGPFTKDLSYSKGFVQIYNFLSVAVRRGKLNRIPLLFCGKTQLRDMRTLYQGIEDGLVQAPRFLPPPFRDLNALVAWLCYSNFFRQIDLNQIELDYSNLF